LYLARPKKPFRDLAGRTANPRVTTFSAAI
jgi:hypothetical protein